MAMMINYKLDDYAFRPMKAHEVDAGIDIRTPIDITVRAHSSIVVQTGVHVEIPEGYCGFIKSKSGLNVRHDLTAEGVVDCGYTGEITVKMYNNGDDDYHLIVEIRLLSLLYFRHHLFS